MGLVYRNGRPYLYRSDPAGRSSHFGIPGEGRGRPSSTPWKRSSGTSEISTGSRRSERKEPDDLERALDELAEQARDLARDALTAAGYHQHHRGEWRKRRVSRHREGEAGRAGHGQLGGRQADRLGRGEGRQREDEGEAQGMSFATSPPSWPGRARARLRRVLAETAATCLVRLPDARSPLRVGATSGDGMTLAQSEHAQRRMDRAHRRFLSTLKTLAAVRRLALPALQINVARQQVNQLNAGGSS